MASFRSSFLRPSALVLIACMGFPGFAATIRVPQDKSTIQAAIDTARNGDTVRVAPGTYREQLKIEGKTITLASDYIETRSQAAIEATILQGASPDGKKGAGAILSIGEDAGAETQVIGFTFLEGDHGILNRGRVQALHNRFLRNRDAFSFESGSAIVRGNLFEGNRDDGIDMDGASQGVIEDNIVRDNRDDGIEIRLHKREAGTPLEITIRGNVFTGNGGDGVQLIDYPGKTDRTIRIERNLIYKNAMAAIGSMADGKTKQNFAGAELEEPVFVVNNTIADSNYGITGGDNMVLLNNIFLRTAKIALKRVQGDSAAGRNLLWESGVEFDDCDLDQDAFIRVDPKLDASYRPMPGSPCLAGGVGSFTYNGGELKLPATTDSRMPDLGASGLAKPQ